MSQYGEMRFDHPKAATPVSVERFADVGPGRWWFVHHPDGYLIEVGADEMKAGQLAFEINAGRSSLMAKAAMLPPRS